MKEAKVMTTGVQEARKNLRLIIDAAANDEQHTVIERRGKPVAVLVPVDWYIEAGGDPRESLEQIAAAAEQRAARES
jgi:prevent-host-death family protein